jgi:hypothetical protein
MINLYEEKSVVSERLNTISSDDIARHYKKSHLKLSNLSVTKY